MIEEKLKNKIIDLFEYREFPYLFKLAEASPLAINTFTQKLIELQASIYYLDAHLESNWVTNNQTLNECWEDINFKLSQFGLDDNQIDLYTNHIKKYQKHELELRKNMLPTRFKMEFFYFYKSCDVKLLRKLIYKEFPRLNRYSTLSDWRYFDLVTEVNDDVEDVFEDMETINGNRFLISLFKQSPSVVEEKFSHFLDYVKNKSEQRFNNPKTELIKLIHEKTLTNVKLTKELIIKNGKELSQMDSSSVLLFDYLDKFKAKISA